ncbi:Cytochrome P450 monooxygenase [Pseudocercospora fuligena]|uniref:Cytochrome P450 monooxygenase n=1 Tax=Pseudocercospora fuligena TaxID=685502 RepID=A0A8H6VNZ4_9PEZI|nr:Cytochrome P450 monooxygenase [Pseudocercospora fuligena]
MSPSFPGHEYLATPCFSFLVEHPTLDRSLVFDLGIRKDWWNYSPFLTNRFKNGGYVMNVEKTVREILEENSFDATKLEAVVWSHWHFDHIGNVSEFEKSTALIVGPGFKKNLLPAYPTDPDSALLESDFEGRELVELEMSSDLWIGEMEAVDYFGDGSLYFLNSPGHAHGHICALARVTANPPSFILMDGDSYHHAGELPPSPYMPLPLNIEPSPFSPMTLSSCPGALFEPILRDGNRTMPIYESSAQTKVQMHLDAEEAKRTIEKLQQADVHDHILMVAAHDESLLDILGFYPKKANDFLQKGFVRQARWRFLRDFAKAIGYEGEIEGKRDWAPMA